MSEPQKLEISSDSWCAYHSGIHQKMHGWQLLLQVAYCTSIIHHILRIAIPIANDKDVDIGEMAMIVTWYLHLLVWLG